MKPKELLREYVEVIVNGCEQAGVDLTTDRVTLSFSYPDMPHIAVVLEVGGIFSNEYFNGSEEVN